MVASQNDCLLGGRLVLVVQRRWLMARQLSSAFESEGARVLWLTMQPQGHWRQTLLIFPPLSWTARALRYAAN